jgi:hypothetical protein
MVPWAQLVDSHVVDRECLFFNGGGKMIMDHGGCRAKRESRSLQLKDHICRFRITIEAL